MLNRTLDSQKLVVYYLLQYVHAWKFHFTVKLENFKQLLDVKYFRKKVFFSQIIERVPNMPTGKHPIYKKTKNASVTLYMHAFFMCFEQFLWQTTLLTKNKDLLKRHNELLIQSSSFVTHVSTTGKNSELSVIKGPKHHMVTFELLLQWRCSNELNLLLPEFNKGCNGIKVNK